jgi:hypothetical protein
MNGYHFIKTITPACTVLLLLAPIFVFCAHKSAAQRQADAALDSQVQERVIIREGDYKTPVRINSIHAKGRAIVSNKKFLDDDDWLNGLAVEIANRSDKTITFLEVMLIFRRPEGHSGPPAVWNLKYGDNPFRYEMLQGMPTPHVKPVMPLDYIELKLSDVEHDVIRRFLRDAKFTVINKVEIRVTIVGFSDGTVWSIGGRTMQRRPK